MPAPVALMLHPPARFRVPEGFARPLPSMAHYPTHPSIYTPLAPAPALAALNIITTTRFRVPEGFARPLPSTADGGAAPTPHHLALRIWKRKESGAVLEVGASVMFAACDMATVHDLEFENLQHILRVQTQCGWVSVENALLTPHWLWYCGAHAHVQSISSQVAAAKAGAAAPAAAQEGAAPAAAQNDAAPAAAAAAAEASHGTPLLILYGSNTGEACCACS